MKNLTETIDCAAGELPPLAITKAANVRGKRLRNRRNPAAKLTARRIRKGCQRLHW